MTIWELLEDIPGRETLDESVASLQAEGLTCDSRRAKAGQVFVCIDGTAVDGHRFAHDALDAGASLVVTQRPMGLPRELCVPSTRRAWAQMCANWFGRPASHLHLIGVTGTNGKTSTTYMLKAILERAGHKVGLIGTIQNMVGERILPSGHTTPDPYDLQSMLSLMVHEGCTHAVMEVSSHALDQDRVAGCRFDAAVFTNLTQDHLDYHKTMQRYAEAKRRLFQMAKVAVVNIDDPWAPTMTEGFTGKIVTFSASGREADFAAEDIKTLAGGVAFTLNAGGERLPLTLSIPGRFSVYNALGAAGAAFGIGVELPVICEALSGACGVRGRAEVVPVDRPYTVVIDYAHTPDGLENICKTLYDGAKGRLLVLFGCGGDRYRGKRAQMAATAAKYADYLIITSDNPRTEDPMAIIQDILEGLPEGFPHIVVENRADAVRAALAMVKEGDTLLLAGKGHETYQILKDKVVHLDEREIIAETLGGEAQPR